MVNQGDKGKDKSDFNFLRGWQRNQLKLLREFAVNRIISQTMISGASGMRQGTHALGGKLTALTRSNLIQKAGRDDNGQWTWQLNDEEIDRKRFLEWLKRLDIK